MKNLFIFITLILLSGLDAQEIPEKLADKHLVFEILEGYTYSMCPTDDCRYNFMTYFPENISVGINAGETIGLAVRFKDPDISGGVAGKELVLGLVKDGATYLDNSTEQSDIDRIQSYFEYSSGTKYPVGNLFQPQVPFNDWNFYLEISFHDGIVRIIPKADFTIWHDFSHNSRVWGSYLYSPERILSIGDYYYVYRYDWPHISSGVKGERYISVLAYNPPEPKVKIKEQSFFNGVNKFVNLKDFIYDPLDGDNIPENDVTISVTEVQAHPSVSVVDGKFQVNLGSFPVTEAGEAVYSMTVTNAFGSDTEQITLKLYASSIKINKSNNGDTEPSGIIGGTPGESVEITAIADANYNFSGWTGGDIPAEKINDNPITLTFPETEQLEITPVFEENPYIETCQISLDFDGSMGIVMVTTGSDETEYTSPPAEALVFEKNTTVKLKAVAKTGNEFLQWLGDVSISQYKSEEFEIVLSANKRFSALFETKTVTDSSNSDNDSNSSTPPTVTVDSSGTNNDALLSEMLLRMNLTSFGTGKVTETSSDQQPSSGFGGATGNKYTGFEDFFKDRNKTGNSEISEFSETSDQYNFKYQVYEDDNGQETYYSTEEAESTRDFYNSIESFWNAIFETGGE